MDFICIHGSGVNTFRASKLSPLQRALTLLPCGFRDSWVLQPFRGSIPIGSRVSTTYSEQRTIFLLIQFLGIASVFSTSTEALCSAALTVIKQAHPISRKRPRTLIVIIIEDSEGLISVVRPRTRMAETGLLLRFLQNLTTVHNPLL